MDDGAEIATEIEIESFDYWAGATRLEGTLARPAHGSEPRPGVLLCHDWSGFNAGMRRQAEQLARAGYVCVGLDVYGKGVRGDEAGDNSRLMNPLLADRALLRERLLAGHAMASHLADVDATRLAAVGFCFGGLCALDLARAAPAGLRAVVSVHGVYTPPRLGPQPPIAASVLLLHGWEDPVGPLADVVALADELTAAQADWQLHAYGHARHAFTFDGAHAPERGIAHHPLAQRRAMAAMHAFLRERLAAA